MNVVRELGRLRSSLRKLSVLVVLTVILQIGIIILVLGRIEVRIQPPQKATSTNPKRDSRGERLSPGGKINHFSTLLEIENTLLNIFQIRRPIGVFPIGFSAVPGPEPSFFGFVSWSFGADQCASSEGFLVTFTPGGGVVIFCDYSFPSEDSLQYTVFHNGRQSIQGPGRSVCLTTNESSQTYRKISKLKAPSAPRMAVLPTWKQVYCGMIPEGEMRHNLMMTTPSQGILVALKPTDEGRIGTGRNTKESRTEVVLLFLPVMGKTTRRLRE